MANAKSPSGRIAAALLVALLFLLAASTRAQKSLLRLDAGASGEAFGSLVTAAGDVNDDGFPDFLVADPFDNSAGVDAGLVQLVSGADGNVILTVAGDQVGDLFGFSASAVGDLNLDGKDDVAVGAPGTPGSGAAGYVRVLSGADGSTIHHFVGTQADGQFGYAVGGASSLMADNEPSVIVGAPSQGLSASSQTGAVHVFSGVDGSTLFSSTGADPGDRLGESVSGDFPRAFGSDAGPYAGDNEPSVVVGATAGGNEGTGYVLLLRRSDLSVILRKDGDIAKDGFGSSVALLGDVSGDGVSDVAVGANPYNDVGAPEPGYARILSGADGSTLQSFNTSDIGTGFGRRVAWVDDLSEDGVADIAVSEADADGNGTDAGRIHVYSGADGSVVHTVNGSSGSGLGASVSWAGDLDGDGLAEIIAGAPSDASGGAATGSTYVLALTRLAVIDVGEEGVAGVPRLTSEGRVDSEINLTLFLSDARPFAPTVLVTGASLILDGGKLVPSPDSVVSDLMTDSDGALEYSYPLPPELPAGATFYYQFEVEDPAANKGIARSSTVAAMLP